MKPGYYEIRRRHWCWYSLFKGGPYPRCSVVGVYFTLRGARRAIARDRRNFERPLQSPGPVVHTEGTP
jgi:hypothetical protein